VGSQTQWRGQSDTTLGRFGWGVLIAALLHLPFTPLAALFGLLALLTTAKPPAEPLPPLTGIPVDLLEGEEAEVPPPPTPPAVAPESAVAVEPPAEKPEREPAAPKIRDAGVADAAPSDAAADAEVADAAADESDAGAPDGGITDPVAASGAEKVADVNANVQIKIFSEKIREHPLAPRIGRLIAMVPQWSDFFGPAALDPIADIDRMLVAGPQLRDSSEVAVVVKVNVPQERVREAIDGIVRADTESGSWLDAGVPAATAKVDRAPRVFVMPSPKIVIVTPPSAAENAMKVGRRFTLKGAAGNEYATGKLVTPWRAFRGAGLPFDIPKSIAWARFKLTPDEHGGAILEMIAKDENADAASEHAEYLQRAVSAATELNLGILGALIGGTGRHKFAERVVVNAKGDEIHGYVLFTQRQLGEILDFAPLLFPGRARPRGSGADAGTRTRERRGTPSEPPPASPEPAPSP
jgi:hypothetical protein